MPFITEELYQLGHKFSEPHDSLHQSDWPSHQGHTFTKENEMSVILWALKDTRKRRSEQQIGAGAILEQVTLQFEDQKIYETALQLKRELITALRTKEIALQTGGTSDVTIRCQNT